jgi:hypothetical protein
MRQAEPRGGNVPTIDHIDKKWDEKTPLSFEHTGRVGNLFVGPVYPRHSGWPPGPSNPLAYVGKRDRA